MFSMLSNVGKGKSLFSSLVFATRTSSQHGLSIQQHIEKKRKRAKLGGGQHRIDAQHNKVLHFCFAMCFCWMLVFSELDVGLTRLGSCYLMHPKL